MDSLFTESLDSVSSAEDKMTKFMRSLIKELVHTENILKADVIQKFLVGQNNSYQ